MSKASMPTLCKRRGLNFHKALWWLKRSPMLSYIISPKP